MRWKLAVLSVVTVALACSDNPMPTGTSQVEAPLLDVVAAPASQAIPNRYIVVFKQSVTAPASEAVRIVNADGGKLQYTYTRALKGFAAELSPRGLQALRANPNVARIEQDQRIQLDATQNNPANWGLDRIDQRNLPLSLSYTYNRTGAGVHFYGIDTGINLGHADLSGRLGNGFDAVTQGGNAADCNGHGTHTATTVGGTTFGVAKGVTAHPVRVLDCNGFGTTGGVIAGIDWVTQNHLSPAVANMSLGGGASTALDNAVAASVASGVTYAVSAGNNNTNACTQSPAREPSAITVGATAINDARAGFSNKGTCVDLFAPGVNITAGWIGGANATMTISGTSMASPHVAGVAALYLEANPGATPAQVTSAIVSNATTGKVKNKGTGSPNRLLYMGFITGGGGGGNQPPTANFVWSCTAQRLCTFDGTGSTDDVGVVTYSWQFKSTTATGPVVQKQYQNPQPTFNVTLTVTDGGGLSGSVTQAVTVP